MIIFKKTKNIMVLEKESSPDAQEQKANSKLYPKALKKGFVNKNILSYHCLILCE